MPILMDAKLGNEMGDMTPAELKVFVGVATMLGDGIEIVTPISRIAEVTGVTPLWVRACLRSLDHRRVLSYESQTTGAQAMATIQMCPDLFLSVKLTPSAATRVTDSRRAAQKEWRSRCLV